MNKKSSKESKLRKSMEKYCEPDTEGMKWIIDRLKQI